MEINIARVLFQDQYVFCYKAIVEALGSVLLESGWFHTSAVRWRDGLPWSTQLHREVAQKFKARDCDGYGPQDRQQIKPTGRSWCCPQLYTSRVFAQAIGWKHLLIRELY